MGRWMVLGTVAMVCVACRGGIEKDAGQRRGDATAAPGAAGGLLPRVTALPVNTGSHGMIARARWTLSPDSTALLVVEDATGVENEPVPNGFLLAREGTGVLVQRDSVWDVAPNPAWSRIAFSRAYLSRPAPREQLTDAEWGELAARVGLPARHVRRGAFLASGMRIAYGVGRPVVVELPSGTPGVDSAAFVALPVADGWRVRWTRDGDSLSLGSAPVRATDDAPPSSWRLVDRRTGTGHGAILPEELATVRWTDGPLLDIAVPLDSIPLRALRIAGGTIGTRDGRIHLTRELASTPGTPTDVDIGPGVALAATRSGELIAAIAPNPRPGPYEPPTRLVVYRVEW